MDAMGGSLNASYLKKQLVLISREVRAIEERIKAVEEDKKSMIFGYECIQTYTSRLEQLQNHTKPGRDPNKPMVALILSVLGALRNGPVSEKSIKDFVASACCEHGLKQTNRGSIAGANIEVSAVCSILCALGLIEPSNSENVSKRISAIDAEEEGIVKILPTPVCSLVSPVLLARWSRVMAQTRLQDEAKVDTGVIDVVVPPTGNQETTGGPEADSEMDFMDIFIESSEHLEGRGLGTPGTETCATTLVIAASDGEKEKEGVLLDSGTKVSEGELVSKSQTPRRGPSSSRVWSSCVLPASRTACPSSSGSCCEYVRPEQLSWLDAEAILDAWHRHSYHEGIATELEEKLVRRLTVQCGIKVPLRPFRTGTRFLKRSHGSVSRPTCSGESALAESHIGFDFGQSYFNHNTCLSGSTGDSGCLAANVLIDKVKRTKRQRLSTDPADTASLASSSHQLGMFDSNCLNDFGDVVDRACGDFWMRMDSIVEQNEVRKKSSSDSVTLAEFMAHVSGGLNSIIFSSGLAANSSLRLAGGAAYVSIPMVRRYCRPLELPMFGHEYAPPFARVLSDLPVTTLPIPWTDLAVEFQTLSGQQEMSVALSALDHSVGFGMQFSTSKSRDLACLDESFDQADPTLQRRPSADVLAPTYRNLPWNGTESKIRQDPEIICKPQPATVDPVGWGVCAEWNGHNESVGSNCGEDISDATMLRRHDEGLRKMRDNWAIIQQLKVDTQMDAEPSHRKAGAELTMQDRYFMSASSSVRHYRTYGHSIEPMQSRPPNGDDDYLGNMPSSFPHTIGERLAESYIAENRAPLSGTNGYSHHKVVKKRGRPPKQTPRGCDFFQQINRCFRSKRCFHPDFRLGGNGGTKLRRAR